MIWATVSSRSCFCWLYTDFGIDYLVTCLCRVMSCVVGKGCFLWPVLSVSKILLDFALLHFVFQGQTYLLLQVPLDFLLLYSSPMATHSITLAWKIPWMEEPHGLQPRGEEELDTTERLRFHFSLSCIEEGHGNPLQCSCLENPRDSGAWWAVVFGVAQSQTRLKWLNSRSSMMKKISFFGVSSRRSCRSS